MPAELPAAGATFRVGTFNMASGKGADGSADLQPIADVLEGLDFVALQEVRGGPGTTGGGPTGGQAQTLGQRLGLGWLYAPAETRWGCKQFGNAVLSRLRVSHWQQIPLPREFDRSYRNVVLLVVDLGEGQTVRVLATHVTQRDPRDRDVQLRAVFELFLAMEEPAILLGDLNSPPDCPAIRDLLQKAGVDDPVGRLAQESHKDRVDWILVRGLRCVAAGVRDEAVSDHPLYWVEIERPDALGPHPAARPAQPALQNEVE